MTIAFGALLGVLVTLTSVGAGAIGVLVLLLLYPALPLPRIVAADIAHASIGSVDWSLLGWLLVGSLPASGSAAVFRIGCRNARCACC